MMKKKSKQVKHMGNDGISILLIESIRKRHNIIDSVMIM